MNLCFPRISHPRQLLLLTSIAALGLSGCEKAQPVTYQIPKEERSVTMPMPGAGAPAASAAAPAAAGNMQVLPGMEAAAQQAGGLEYTVPAGWEELPATGIRKANFKITSDTGSAEVTVLTFPGDVGGRLANINRWRQQVGLAPATPEDLPAYTAGTDISNHRGLYVRLEGETQSILGALLPFHDNTWFFKMLGDNATVLANEDAMKAFLDSVQLEDHSH